MGRCDVPVEHEFRGAVGPAGQPRARAGLIRHPEPRLQPATGVPSAPGPAAGDQKGTGPLGQTAATKYAQPRHAALRSLPRLCVGNFFCISFLRSTSAKMKYKMKIKYRC